VVKVVGLYEVGEPIEAVAGRPPGSGDTKGIVGVEVGRGGKVVVNAGVGIATGGGC
jgi:hypothetical protein